MKKDRLSFLAPMLALGFNAQPKAKAETDPKNERDLLIVSNLETHGRKDYAWLYRMLEGMSVSLAERKLKDSYRNVYVLAGSHATAEKFSSSLQTITQEPAIHSLDVFVHLHGAKDRLWFEEGPMQTEELGTQIQSKVVEVSKLRALYSSACYGESHAPGFLAAGFVVANGAEHVNTNGAYDYPAFMKAWKADESFASAQEAGNSPFWIKFYDGIASVAGFTDVGSYKIILGDGATTIGKDRML